MTNKKDIASMAVLGAGSYGTALAITLSQSEGVLLWGYSSEHVTELKETRKNTRYLADDIVFPPSLEITDDLEYVFKECRDIIIAIPSHVYAELLKKIKPYIKSHHRIISATKGLQSRTGLLLEETIHQVFGKDFDRYAFLSGPSFAIELARYHPTALNLATKNRELGLELQSKLNSYNTPLKVYLTDDTIGVQLGGAIKNVIAIAVGLCDGLGYASNSRTALITEGLSEITKLGLAMNADLKTFMGLSVLGDLILTCTDNKSRNRRYGLMLAKGKTSEEAFEEIGQIVEGYHNIKEIRAIANKYKVKMPIINSVYDIVYGGKSPRRASVNLLLTLRDYNEDQFLFKKNKETKK